MSAHPPREVTRIYRYEVPVDGQWHTITSGKPLYVASRQSDLVEFWSYSPDDPSTPVETRRFRVYGTGHSIPRGLTYVDTAVVPDVGLVWHLLSDPWKMTA